MAGRKKGNTIRQGFICPVFAVSLFEGKSEKHGFAWHRGGEIMAGTLAVSEATGLHAEFKAWLEKMGFEDVTVTGKKNDALNTVICDRKPRLVIIDSWFYRDGTPRRIGELLKLFPRLNIAVVSLHDFPLSNAPWFIWEGAKSYLHLWEGYGEFKRGFQIVRDGKPYVAPKVQSLIDRCGEWPDTKNKMTRRQKECLVMLCCGLTPGQIGEALNVSRRTVYSHLYSLYAAFHVHNRTEMVALAWEMELVTPKDIRLYNRKKERRSDKLVPQWAAVKRKCDSFFDYE